MIGFGAVILGIRCHGDEKDDERMSKGVVKIIMGAVLLITPVINCKTRHKCRHVRAHLRFFSLKCFFLIVPCLKTEILIFIFYFTVHIIALF